MHTILERIERDDVDRQKDYNRVIAIDVDIKVEREDERIRLDGIDVKGDRGTKRLRQCIG